MGTRAWFRRGIRVGRRLAFGLAALLSACGATGPALADEIDQARQRWAFFRVLPLTPTEAPSATGDQPSDSHDPASDKPTPATDKPSPWCDFILPPEVFSNSRDDLGDLRLVDAQGRDVPYALRVRTPDFRDERVEAKQFNEVQAADGSTEWSFDLGANPREHNQLEVDTMGDEFRRLAVVEGSDDGQKWLKLTERTLLRFHALDGVDGPKRDFEVRHLRYSPSRYRYLRLRVQRDAEVDKDPVELHAVHVVRRVQAPGEFVSKSLSLHGYLPTKAQGAPASSWEFPLLGIRQPVGKLVVDFAEAEFARDFQVEAAGPEGSQQRFTLIGAGQWRRRAGEPRLPLEAELTINEYAPVHDLARLRLTIVDHENKPLDLTSATLIAPARQIVFAKLAESAGPLRLYYGNPKAEAPHYDLERNLPIELTPAPLRLKLEGSNDNPAYEPEPPPLSERAPWLIYLVLGGASVAVAIILIDVGRTSIARHDVQQATA